MAHKFKKLTHCQYTGRELERPEYLYRGFLFRSEPWKNAYGHWVAIQQGSGKRFVHNTRKMVKFHVDNFILRYPQNGSGDEA
tara:strand:+ start:76 stop:321 length:246 start_codon:yes stop_codon:yes gene_type:complete